MGAHVNLFFACSSAFCAPVRILVQQQQHVNASSVFAHLGPIAIACKKDSKLPGSTISHYTACADPDLAPDCADRHIVGPSRVRYCLHGTSII